MASKKPAKKLVTAKKPAVKAAAPKAAAPVKLEKAKSATTPRNTNTYSYTYSEFIENIRAFTGMQKRTQAKEICEDFARFIKEALKKGYKLPLLGLGKLYVRQTKPRQGRNPATGEVIQIPAKRRVRFAPTKLLKEEVLK
jgi:DNA-binding protein HU-beta